MPFFTTYKISENLNTFEQSINVVRVPPIWGRDMSPQSYFEHMRPRIESGRRLLLPGELGCALSHLEIYKKVVESQHPALILEDDIKINNNNMNAVKDVIETIQNPDYINFAQYRHSFKKHELTKGIYVADTSSGFWGTAAYYISKNMAKYLLEQHSNHIQLADNWQEFFVHCPYAPFYAPLFIHHGIESQIGSRAKAPQNPSLRAGIKLRILRFSMTFLATPRYMLKIKKAKKIINRIE